MTMLWFILNLIIGSELIIISFLLTLINNKNV